MLVTHRAAAFALPKNAPSPFTPHANEVNTDELLPGGHQVSLREAEKRRRQKAVFAAVALSLLFCLLVTIVIRSMRASSDFDLSFLQLSSPLKGTERALRGILATTRHDLQALRKNKPYEEYARMLNEEQIELALQLVPRVQTHQTYRKLLPIAMYVHHRVDYFREALRALRKVKGIEESVLIISHDGDFQDMLEVVRQEVNFVPVIELMHPGYGKPLPKGAHTVINVRDHWMWVLEQLFDVIRLDQGFVRFDTVLFVEEDHHVAPDFLDSAKHLLSESLRFNSLPMLPEFDSQYEHPTLRTISKGYEGNPKRSKEFLRPTDVFGITMYNHMSRSNVDKPESSTQFELTHDFNNHGYTLNRQIYEVLKSPQGRKFMQEECIDGWDVVIHEMMRRGMLPKVILRPILSRVLNIGARGMNCNEDGFRAMGLDKVYISKQREYPWDWHLNSSQDKMSPFVRVVGHCGQRSLADEEAQRQPQAK